MHGMDIDKKQWKRERQIDSEIGRQRDREIVRKIDREIERKWTDSEIDRL